LSGTYRLLKNIAGLWLVESCRQAWALEGTRLSHEEVTAEAAAAAPFPALIDPDAPDFLNPPHMPRQIQAVCRETGQPVPEERGAILRCIHESLALKFRLVLEQTEVLAGRRFNGLHIVGGGANNTLLCQLTADAIGRPVWAGPAEATAIGNLLAQFMAANQIATLREGRAVVRASIPLTTYEPRRTLPWDEAFARFLAIIGERPIDARQVDRGARG
jgi:rhamnulokinase